MTTAVMSDYLETKLINHTLRNTQYTTPGTAIWVSLHTASPTDAGTGTECSGTDYVRIQCSTWDDPVLTSATENTNVITWPTAGAGGWGHVTHVGIWDNDGTPAGNLLFYGELSTHNDIAAGVTFTIAAGALDISLGGAISAYLAGELINHILRNTAYTTPGASIYVGLLNTGAAEVSTSGTAYQRVQVTAWDAPGATDGATENTNIITFPTPTATWGVIEQSAVYDGGTEGADNILFGPSDLGVKTYEPTTGDVVAFAAGALDITVS
jgi:hypothetical protein